MGVDVGEMGGTMEKMRRMMVMMMRMMIVGVVVVGSSFHSS